MTFVGDARGGAAESALLAAARSGDEDAFRALTQPYARELHVHCYRMLGSLQDAEDALQETLLRAWRHLRRFEGRSSLRGWLYKIATNVCLTASERRRREPSAPDPRVDVPHLSPYPDELLDQVDLAETNPAIRYDLRESVQLAFLAAIQLLPPRQRAVLILRDVLGWSAREVADLLETTVGSVNSALHRGRESLERQRRAGHLRAVKAPSGDEERSLLRRYVEAWDSVDIEGLVSLLREDAVLWMPPEAARIDGSRPIGGFFATVPADGALDQIRLVMTRANRQPALAAYLWDEEAGVYRPYGLMVLTVDGDAIAEITGFPDPALFARFGLAAELEQ
jgi:RNA polymerase sigma-70 factor (ECF subfamily)